MAQGDPSGLENGGAGPGPGLAHDRPDGLGDGAADDGREGLAHAEALAGDAQDDGARRAPVELLGVQEEAPPG